MSKKVLIISSTPRANGNSEVLCEAFSKGAKEKGNRVELISLRKQPIDYCIGCYYCAKHEGKCFQKDNLNEILEKVIQADVLVFATPIYFYSITAQLKAFLDRTVARYTQITNKDLYLIATCADTSKQAITGAKTAIDGWLDCVENVRLKGILYGTNLTNVGDAVKEEKILREAYRMGENI